MKLSVVTAERTSPARAALAEHLAILADLQSRVGGVSARAVKQPDAERNARTESARQAEAGRSGEHLRLQQLPATAVAKRDQLIADIMVDEELPRRIRTYQDLVLQVNVAWNDILAYDDTMRRRYPERPSIFNTAGPHERAVKAPSTDRSPVPALAIDARRLFAAACAATERFIEALAADAGVETPGTPK
jgi:hypothetical protein